MSLPTLQWLAAFFLGAVVGTFVDAWWIRRVAKRVDPRPTNIYTIINLAHCHLGDHQPLRASIWWNVSLMRWEAGCQECGAQEYGKTPHEAAMHWNERQMRMPQEGR